MIKRAFFLVLFAYGAMGLAQVALTEFPLGRTEMGWTLTDESGQVQELRLTVEVLAKGEYLVELGLTMRGTAAQLESLGFLGAPLFIQAMGTQIDLSSLLVLMSRRRALAIGETYTLPGGTFRVKEKVLIAGVECLVGDYRFAERTDFLIEVGMSLSDPVYFLPLLRVRQGDKVSFEMILSRYQRP